MMTSRCLATGVLSHVLLLLLMLRFGSASLFGKEYGSPRTFQAGDSVPFEVNPLTSVHTLFDTYDDILCPNMEELIVVEMLQGRDITTPNPCKILCNITLDQSQADELSFRIRNSYHHNWRLDNVPSANMYRWKGGTRVQKHYGGGFPVGFRNDEGTKEYIFNHFNFHVDYSVAAHGGGFRIVGFGVEPLSVKHKYHPTDDFENPLQTCPSKYYAFTDIGDSQQVEASEQIFVTYNIFWYESEVSWSQRWTVYLTENYLVPPQVHWYSIFNSLSVILVLSILNSCILVRNLKRDVAANRGRSGGNEDDDDERKGWKTLHGDVFRPPQTMPHVLCAMVGIGVQLAGTGLVVLLLALCNILTQAKPGSFGIATWAVYTFVGSPIAGYVSSRLFHLFGAKVDDGQKCQWITALLFPAAVFVVFALFSAISPAVTKLSFGAVCGIMAVTSLSTMLLVQQGWNRARDNNKNDDFPTATLSVIRPIPKPTYHCRSDLAYCIFTCVSPYLASRQTPFVAIAVVGIVGFAATYVDLFFIMTSLFMEQYYYSFGFTLIVYVITIIICCQVTLLMIYHRLNNENHYWWWPAFGCAGSIGGWILAYSCLWVHALEVSPDYWAITYSLYFGKMLLISFATFLLFGAVGTLAALGFVCKLYSTVRPQGDASYVELLNANEDDHNDNQI